ncbi:hypothetical protein V2O64_09245 [Verrucomicrobiaceae bacterium 227]
MPNTDQLDFSQLYFSLREDCGMVFYRCYAERSWFYPLGDKLGYFEDIAVAVKVVGADLPDANELNRLISDRMKLFPEMFECALGKYVEVIGVDDFSERLIDNELSAEMECSGDNAMMSKQDLVGVWKNRECHRISKLAEVTYNPLTKHLAFFFEIEWEGYFSDYHFALLLSGDEIDYGIDQSYWGFCEDSGGTWR